MAQGSAGPMEASALTYRPDICRGQSGRKIDNDFGWSEVGTGN